MIALVPPFTIRPAMLEDADAIARVHVASWRSTYPGMVPDHVLESLSEERRARMWRLTLGDPYPEQVFVAVDSAGTVAGFASGGPERSGEKRYPGELYAIYLLAEAQRNHLGSRLTLTVANALLERNYKAMLVWVLDENAKARRFYEALGAEFLYTKPINIGDEDLIEAAYGWKDLPALAARLTQQIPGT